MLLEEKSKTTNDDHKTLKAEWTTFFSAAKKQSRKKRILINSVNTKQLREEKENSERVIQHWLNLYSNRWDSDDAYEQYNAAEVPKGAWGRVP